MANFPPYTTGTVTVTNGSAIVTGDGTAWVSADFGASDQIIVGGLVGIIESVDSETQLTLALPWAGASGEGLAHATVFHNAGDRIGTAVNALVALLSGGNLKALAGLEGAADKVPYFTGSGQAALADFKAAMRAMLGLTPAKDQMAYFGDDGNGGVEAALTTLTAFARTLLDDADAAAMRSTLNAVQGDTLAVAGFVSGALTTPYFRGNDANNTLVQLVALSNFSSGGGWTKLPNGTILQWGTNVVTTDANGFGSVAFPTAFSSASSYGVIAFCGDSNIGSRVDLYRDSSTPWPQRNSFAFKAGAVLNSLFRVDWIAIGT